MFAVRKTQMVVAFAIGALLTFFLVVFFRFETLEILSYDTRFVWREDRDFSAKIVCIGIDEDSFVGFKGIDPKMATWPWSPVVFAQVIDNLNAWGAKVIAFDKLFSEPDIRPEPEQGKNAEEIMAEAMNRHGKVILACKQEVKMWEEQGREMTIKTFTAPSEKSGTGLLLNGTRLGSINVPLDADHGIRWAALEFEHGEQIIPSFARAVAETYLGIPADQSGQVSANEYRIGDRIIPLDQRGFMAINYTGKRVPMVPLFYVWDGDLGLELIGVEKEIFRDAIVLIGAWTTDLHDFYRIPHCRKTGFSDRPMIPGAEIQAQAVNTVLSGDYLRRVSHGTGIRIALGCGLLIALFCSVLSVQTGIAAFLVAMAAYAGIAFWMFADRNWILPMAQPMLTMFVAGAGVTTYRYIREAREKRFLKDIFSKTTDQKLVDLIIENPSLVKLGGEKREATILFSDIRNYSAMSEGMSPEDLIQHLNEYYSAWTEVIFRNGGMIDKFMGDAVMAIFGAPVANDTHAYDACRTAMEMLEELERLCAQWDLEGRKTFRIGIGIHTGHAIFGNLGSEQRFSYTCIGDAVNIASRIEGINKILNTTVLISEDTYTRVQDRVIAESKGQNEIRGRKGMVELFELKGMRAV
ncbi:MAG TPA: adenylate/guanylate cyclase domain-containing protein [bacterium]|nr:adenylate/guanylate cyclase domain-containing protein [bacterium]